MKVKNVPIDKIKYPKVMLRSPEDMTGIEDLASSILVNGLLNPLTVRPEGEDYILLAGGRRLEAIKRIGWDAVPCNVITPPKEIERTITLVENAKRADVNPLEEAQYYEYLSKELNLTQEQIGNLAGTTAAHVNQMLKLLTLDEYTMGALAVGDVSASQARELARCTDTPYRQYLVDIIKKSGASVLVLKRWVDQRIGFVAQRSEQMAEAFVEPVTGAHIPSSTRCELGNHEVTYGGLKVIYACDECYIRFKQALEASSGSESREASQ